jgi:regulation of enolase protein 1 (concanavalin A-like superfamily)
MGVNGKTGLWLHEPPEWNDDGSKLSFRTKGGVDFWRSTLVNTVADDGHLYYNEVNGDFAATVRVSGDYRDQYDQAGLFVRQDQNNWLKCGVEHIMGNWAERYKYDGSALVVCSGLTTNGWSEWSPLPQLPKNPDFVWMQVVREGKTFFVSFSLDGSKYHVIKLFALPDATKVLVGRYATSPAGKGFNVSFDSYSLSFVQSK